MKGINFLVITLKSSSNDKQLELNVLYRPNRAVCYDFCDFLVLEQLYLSWRQTNLVLNGNLKALFKQLWWFGFLKNNRRAFNSKYPDSLFKIFEIKWCTEECESLSLWDLFSIDSNRLPKHKNCGLKVRREEFMEYN